MDNSLEGVFEQLGIPSVQLEALSGVFNYLKIDPAQEIRPPRLCKLVVIQAFGAGAGCTSNLELLKEALVMHLFTGARVVVQDDMIYALPEYLWNMLLDNPFIVVIHKGEYKYIDTHYVLKKAFELTEEEEHKDVFLVVHQAQRLRAYLTAERVGFNVTQLSLQIFPFDPNSTQTHTRTEKRFRRREYGAIAYYRYKGYIRFKDFKKKFF